MRHDTQGILGILGTLLLAVLTTAATQAPKKIGGEGPIDRPTNHTTAWCFSEWGFCPTPLDTFVADGDSATAVFRVRNWKTGMPGTQIDFHLDNVVVLTRALHDANLGSLVGFPEYNCLYPQTGTVALDFASLLGHPGVVYHTDFAGSIGPEWTYDPAHVGYATEGSGFMNLTMFDDPFQPAPSATGNMAIGTGVGPEFVEVTLQLDGLTPGTEYVFTYWSASSNDAVGFNCDPGQVHDDWELSIYGEELVCVPDLPTLGAKSVRTTTWDPGPGLWEFQVEFENSGAGPATGIGVEIVSVPGTVTVVDGDAPVAFLGTEPRTDSAWAGDSFALDLSGHSDPFVVVGWEYTFENDCGGISTTSGVTILGDPSTYPTAIPRPQVGIDLGRPVPNPFNPRTVLPLRLATAQSVELSVLDVRGRVVRVLHSGPLSAGEHRFGWDGRDAQGRGVAAGVYLARVRGSGLLDHQRMVLLK